MIRQCHSADSFVECGLLAERGDCAFYECIETTYPCGQRGYTLGYGHHYCDRFNVYFHELTSEVSHKLFFAKILKVPRSSIQCFIRLI